jgi:hypothetical protein
MSEAENAEAPAMGRDVFLALAAIGWADGHLDPNEADAIVSAAVEVGLELDEIAEIEAACKEPVALDVIDRSKMTKADRLFVYAVASWMTRLDGDISDEEKVALAELGERLAVPERPRWHADQIVEEVAKMGQDERPARFDLSALRKILTERLDASHAARVAAAAAAEEAPEASAESADSEAVTADEGGSDQGAVTVDNSES